MQKKQYHILWLLSVLLLPYQAVAMPHNETLNWFQHESKIPSQLSYPDIVDRLYQANQRDLIWTDEELADQLEAQLERIQQAGFSPLFDRRLQALHVYRDQHSWFEYDALATDTLLLYLSYADLASSQGQSWFFGGKLTQDLPAPKETRIIALTKAITEQRISHFIDNLAPSSDDYPQLVTAYQQLEPYVNSVLPRYSYTGVIHVGEPLPDRDILLQRMQVVGIDISRVRTDVAYYDASLEPAVKAFQRMHGLQPDGVIGAATLKWINISPKTRQSILALNMERDRLWPTQRDTLIIVNIPSYQMRYWFHGKEEFDANVIVGRSTRQTPVMLTHLNALILNPTWNVPDTIMAEDLIPKAKRDPSYLARQNIEIIRSWTSSEVIDPAQVDWANINPKTFPYRLRQKSGPANSLGLYKFNTPNNLAIYLHDTPAKGLFNRAQRAFSSGCIRVHHADQFAQALLRSQGLNEMAVEKNRGRSNAVVSMKQRVPVHLIYKTAWAANGQAQYRDDVYHYDRKMIQGI